MAMNSFAHIWKERSPWRRTKIFVPSGVGYWDGGVFVCARRACWEIIGLSWSPWQRCSMPGPYQHVVTQGKNTWFNRTRKICAFATLKSNAMAEWGKSWCSGQGRYLFKVFLDPSDPFILNTSAPKRKQDHRHLQVMIRLHIHRADMWSIYF